MSHLAQRLSAAALVAALGGTLLVQSPAQAAAPASVTSAASAAAFRFEVYFPKYVRRGGYLTYTVKVRNRTVRGQHYVALFGRFSSHFRAIKVIRKPRSVKCSVKRPAVTCWIASLDKGDSTTVVIRAWVGSHRGTTTARFGGVATQDRDARLSELKKDLRGSITARARVL
ncbi:hypothetical protein FHR32_008082 [Streptosporangium album]|uniref:DUF11 domain-containing protein n=1 Tax=Streptosporangium album TaxID=47479 RepID=A0A7W7WE11_9ACTN|nr:hypothetical protein [Streptosporangium album]MBB4943681.1 hypothetical protein [Streptosporangium album]